ncbi:hypothetical protein PFISCL1PPCAC_18624, partial [Pristionchus fissidentatus]
MLNGLEMGWIKLDRYLELMRTNIFVTKVIGFKEYWRIKWDLTKYVTNLEYKTEGDLARQDNVVNMHRNDSCTKLISWNELFNNRKLSLIRTGLPIEKEVNSTVYDM